VSAEGLIRRARLALGFTQAELAGKAGVGTSSVSDAELTGNPSIAVLERYGRAMGLELQVFYTGDHGRTVID
jgi:transcriptional regulator with XRE-family HTH domain